MRRLVNRAPNVRRTRRPRARNARLAVADLEVRVVPSAPAPPPGFTANLTSFTNNSPVPVGPAIGVATSTITVSGAGTYLHDLDLTAFIKHTFPGDLDITLTSPAGTAVTITTDNAGTNDDVFNGTLWDDDADPGNPAPFATDTFAASNLPTDTTYVLGTVKPTLTPEEALAAFVGENPNGTWTLSVSDDAGGDSGSLDQWKLDVTSLDVGVATLPGVIFANTTPQAVGPAIGAVTSTIVVSGIPTYLQKLTLQTFLTHTSSGNLDITLTSPAGTVVTVTSDNGGTLDDVFNGTLWDDDADPGNAAPFSANTFAASKLVADTVYTNLTAKPTLTPEEPFGAFIGEDPNGTWTLTVSDDAANDGGTLASWGLVFRGAAPYGTPAASAAVGNVSSAHYGAPAHTFTVTYTDDTAIDVSTLDGADIRVMGPGGYDALATLVGFNPAGNGTPRTATYTIAAPGGSWDGTDNGTYFVNLQPGQVLDTGGTPVPADVLTTFSATILAVVNADDSGAGSLRAALAAANATPGTDAIIFDPAFFATPRTISLSTALPQITDSVVVTGPGSGLLTVRRDSGAAANFRVLDSTAPALTLTGFTVSDGNLAGDGAGLQASGAIALDRMVFSGNQATGANDGGAIRVNSGGLLTLRNSTLSGNSAGVNGGAIYFFSGGSLLMENSTISGNKANGTAADVGGGGIYFFGTASATPPTGFTPSALVVRNSTIANNTAESSGGGIALTFFTGTLVVQNSTITGNAANNTAAGQGGGGIARVDPASATAGVITIVNSVVAGNTNINGQDVLSSNTVNVNFSAVGSDTGYTPSGTSGNNITAGTELKLGILASNGGSTQTVSPLATSPLINAGSNADVPAALTTDQRGTGFLRIFGSAVDIGAFEVQPARVTIDQAAGQPDPTSTPSVGFAVRFTTEVTGFDADDVDLSDSTAGGTLVAAVTGSGATYTVTVTGMTGFGAVAAKVKAGAATDAFGSASLASTSTDNVVTFDSLSPAVAINRAAGQADPVNAGPISFTVQFSEPVTGFTDSDVIFVGSTVGGTPVASVSGAGATYTVSVTGMTGVGDLVVSVPAGGANDAAGNSNEASTSTDNAVRFDEVGSTVTINQAAAQPDPTNAPVVFAVVFDEPVTGFTGADVDLSSSTTAGTLVADVTGSGSTYTVTVTGMAGPGAVVASIPAGAALDLAGNPSAASTSTDGEVTFDPVAPTVTIHQAAGQADPASPGPVLFDVVFGEAVTGFEGSDISFSGSTVGGNPVASVSGSGTTYTVSVTGLFGNGTLVASVPAGRAIDAAGNPNEASTSGDNSVSYLDNPGQLQFDSAVFAASEIGGTVTITVTRTGGGGGPVSVGYATGGGTAGAGADYLSSTGTLNWDNGEAGAKTFTITLQDDALLEGAETIGLALSNPTGGAALGAQSTAEVQLADFEEGLVAFDATVVTEDEDAGTATVLVTRTGGTDGDVTVFYSTVDGTAHTTGDKSNGQLDYTPVSDKLEWKSGVGGSLPILIPIIADTANEGRETITLKLSTSTPGATVGPDSILAIRPSNPRPAGLFIDGDGDVVTIKLAGPGKADYFLTDPDGDSRGPVELIQVSDTNPLKSVLSVTAKKGPLTADGKVTLGGVTGPTGLKSISAAKSNLIGDGIVLGGPLGSVVVADVKFGADIIATGTLPQKTRITAGVIDDETTIQLGTGISALTATKIGVGTITAPSIGTLTVKGNAKAGITGSMESDITVTGVGVVAGRPALTLFSAAGPVVGADIEVTGKMGTFRAGGFTDGSLTAGSVGAMIVKGNLTSSDVTVTGVGVASGKPVVNNLTVTGEVKGADIAVTGNLTALTAREFRDSRLYVNYDPGTSKFGAAATVGSFKVTGLTDGFQDSDVYAPTFKAVSLKSLDETNADLFGFTADLAIGSLRVLTGSRFTYDPTDPGEQGPPLSQFKVKVVV